MPAATPSPLFPGLSMANTIVPKRRIVIAVDGLDKHGKTNFALTAPKPLVYLDFDIGREGVLEKAPDADRIIVSRPFIFMPSEVAWDTEDEKARTAKIMAAAEPELGRFRDTYLRTLREPVLKLANGALVKARTVVIDTGSEAWELLRLCHFGKLSQVKPHHYTEVNGLMRDLVRAAFDADVNVIWLHKLKAEWKDNAEGKGRKTGVLERGGFEGMSYLVQANLLCYRIAANLQQETVVKWKSGEGLIDVPIAPRTDGDLGFRLVVGNSRHDPGLEGLVLSNEMISFPTIAQMMMPDSAPSDWA